MAAKRPLWRRVGIAGYLVAVVIMAVELATSERLPMPWWLVLAGFVGAQLGAGFLIGQWRWLALPLLFVPAAGTAAALSDSDLLAAIGAVLLTGAGLPLLALGIGSAKVLGLTVSVRSSRVLAGVAVAMLAVVVLPLPIALVQKHRTVRFEGARPRIIDERRGAIAGVGLGDRPAGVLAAFGQGRTSRTDRDTGPLDPPDCSCDAASVPSGPSRRASYLRYRKLSFQINGDRVWDIEIVDPHARTTRGVGVGDSLSLVRRAYPELHCGESTYGPGEPTYYPFCAGRTGPGASIYFSADYTRPGTPVMYITVASRFDQAGSSAQPSD